MDTINKNDTNETVSPQLQAVFDLAFGNPSASPQEIREQILRTFCLPAEEIGIYNDFIRDMVRDFAIAKDMTLEDVMKQPFYQLYFLMLDTKALKDFFSSKSDADIRVVRCQMASYLLCDSYWHNSEVRVLLDYPFKQYLKALCINDIPVAHDYAVRRTKHIRNILYNDFYWDTSKDTSLRQIIDMTKKGLFDCSFYSRCLKACEVFEFLLMDAFDEVLSSASDGTTGNTDNLIFK